MSFFFQIWVHFLTESHFPPDNMFKMADGDTDPFLEHNDDEDEGNTTTPSKPDYNATPGP